MRSTRAAQPTGVTEVRPDGITRAGAPFPSRSQRRRDSAAVAQASEGGVGPVGPQEGAPRAPAGRGDLGAKEAAATVAPKDHSSVTRPPNGRRVSDPAKQVEGEPQGEKRPQRNPKVLHYGKHLSLRLSVAQMEKLDELRAGFEELTGSKLSRAAYMRALLDDSTATMEKALATAAAMGGPGDDSALVAATEQLSAVTNQVRLLGINANQVAKAANQDAGDRDRLAAVLEDISIDLDEVKELLADIGARLQRAGYSGLGDES